MNDIAGLFLFPLLLHYDRRVRTCDLLVCSATQKHIYSSEV